MFRNKVNNLQRHTKKQFYSNLESISDCQSNDKKKKKKKWKVVRHFIKSKCASSSISPLNIFPDTDQNEFCFSSKDKVELVNKHFTSMEIV